MFKKKSNPQASFLLSVAESARLRQTVETTPCPACKQQTLTLGKYENGAKGWEAEVSCSNCFFKGVVNSFGFQFSKIDSRGRAREKR